MRAVLNARSCRSPILGSGSNNPGMMTPLICSIMNTSSRLHNTHNIKSKRAGIYTQSRSRTYSNKASRNHFINEILPNFYNHKSHPNCILKRKNSSKSYPEHEVIKLPALSPTMTVGNIVEWNKNVGDMIEAGDSLLVIETDKSCIDFEMQQSGYIAYTSPKKKELAIGEPIGILVDDENLVKEFADFTFDNGPTLEKASFTSDDKKSEYPDLKSEKKENVDEKEPLSKDILSSPSARRLANSLKVDLSIIKGSGPGGRIVNADVLAASSAKETSIETKTSISSHPKESGVEYIDIPLTPLRNAIIKNLAKTKPLVPDYSISLSADVSNILAIKDKLNSNSNGDYKITVNDIIIKATCTVLKLVPELNSHFIGDAIRKFNQVNLSIAIAADDGLYAPVLKNADSLGLIQISKNVKTLAKKTNENKLSPSDMSGGTFSISNMGMYSVESFNSIIVNPQVCILSVGTITDRYMPCTIDKNTLIKRKYINFTLTSDHRAIDGHIAAKWIQQLKKIIEDPFNMLL